MRYERLVEDTRSELARLLTALGLSQDYIEKQIDLCREGKNISIYGVFRGGTPGSWKKAFSKADVESFKRIAVHVLTRLGYEDDDSWGIS